MAHFVLSYPSRATSVCKEPLHRYNAGYCRRKVHCCSSAKEVEKALDYLVSDYGWNVRRLVAKDEEMRKVAFIQAEAFHTPVALFNDFFFEFFKAEVLAGLVYKLRNSPPDRYACLVAESSDGKIVGIVDVTVLRDEDVLKHLQVHRGEEYLYVSGLAVSQRFRRQKIATALLKACHVLAFLWGHHYLVLRAYEQDFGARKLYTNAGYQVVSGDPPWLSTWIGRKRRLLLVKRLFNYLAN